MKRHSRCSITIAIAGIALVLSTSCTSSGSNGTIPDDEILTAEKPAIDTSMVLETLELYRAMRYEGIQEAKLAGVENVHKLVLYGRKMGNLSREIGDFTYLASLDVAQNDLATLPEEISRLHYMQGFYANRNNLVEFPNQLLLLPVLTKIDLSENQIASIPGEILRMDQLTRLTLDKNTLTAIPVQLYELKNLNILELADNGLREIPEGISQLTRLTKLDLANNQLRQLPREITTLSETLVEMNIQGNQIPMEEIEWLISAMPKTRIRY